jgi:hypothetical protein
MARAAALQCAKLNSLNDWNICSESPMGVEIQETTSKSLLAYKNFFGEKNDEKTTQCSFRLARSSRTYADSSAGRRQ